VGRLFWKIFFWFWLTMIIMTFGIALGMVQFFQHERSSFDRPLARLALIQVSAVAAVLEHSEESAAKLLLQEITSNSPLQIFVIDPQGGELLGRTVTELLNTKKLGQKDGANHEYVTNRIAISPAGYHYQVIAKLPDTNSALVPLQRGAPFGLMRPFHRDPRLFSIRLGLAILLSGLVCFWLAWYLASPVRRLREANRRLSEGDLSVRVSKAMGRRRDEIADLGRDFDCMAERLQALILNQKQLLSDVSHELRSPLARLQVALGLARKKIGKNAERDLNRIEQEANRLDELVGQVLTLARLETLESDELADYVDITELLKAIIKDAEFEAVNSNRQIHLVNEISCIIVKANAELLRRALENIIRNAVHYTAEGTYVEVSMQDDIEYKKRFSISVCDHGTGISEEKLPVVFEPFVRLSKARDRCSGGYGLGLSIAERAIRLHNGQVSASNRVGGGLCVSVQLPLP
jgi:signal transduction histidine kinase